jgi:hypothetical protein
MFQVQYKIHRTSEGGGKLGQGYSIDSNMLLADGFNLVFPTRGLWTQLLSFK